MVRHEGVGVVVVVLEELLLEALRQEVVGGRRDDFIAVRLFPAAMVPLRKSNDRT